MVYSVPHIAITMTTAVCKDAFLETKSFYKSLENIKSRRIPELSSLLNTSPIDRWAWSFHGGRTLQSSARRNNPRGAGSSIKMSAASSMESVEAEAKAWWEGELVGRRV